MLESLLLFAAGLLGGMLNSIAGGGTFITFPALLLAGVPPVSANATNTFASCSGYISGAFAFRNELMAHRRLLPGYISFSLVGGLGGAWLLLQTPDRVFREAIPWLLLFATLLFVFGARLNALLARLNRRHRYAPAVGRLLSLLLFLAVCVYGGFFNAGLGIVILSYLVLAGYRDIHLMNGLKLLTSSCVALIAIALFVHDGVIAWREGVAVLFGTLAGGYFAARVSRQVPPARVRQFVVVVSVGITAYYFYSTYFSDRLA